MIKYVNELFNFIESSPTVFHNVEHVKRILDNFNFEMLNEGEQWNIQKGKSYYVIRDYASIICFKVPNEEGVLPFNIVASHNDSPTFKLKPNFELITPDYNKINTEPYGGMIASSWLDRSLGIAGRVMVKTEDGIETRLINICGHNFIIPSVAIHLTRNSEQSPLNMQNDLLPIYSLNTDKDLLLNHIKNSALVEDEKDILSFDLFLYNKDKGTTVGANHEMISSPKIDDLECVFASLEAFLEATPKAINVCAIFDNEEVGSGSNHGAESTFLTDVLERINSCLNQDKYVAYSNSMLASADNAHAVHPAQPQKSDPTNRVFMNKGVVIKYHSGLSYTTEALSASIFKNICSKAGVSFQDYTNRSDLRGGSTLGHIALSKLSIASVDIGLAQLSMHSAFETAGSYDIEAMVKALREFYSSRLNLTYNKIQFS